MIKQVVVYKVVDEIKLKHLYLVYHIFQQRNKKIENEKEILIEHKQTGTI